ncbi:MAG: response regulator, partial [Bacteroidales bacterium]|nr:response regulator [Bacteroidales bacterium]
MTKKNFNLLIVDDIIMNRMLLKEITLEFASNVMEAENGERAIQIIRDQKVDLIFMDIEMPVMNGLETTRYIRNEMEHPSCEIPIVALTAYNPADFFADYKKEGFNELLTKPYSIQKV